MKKLNLFLLVTLCVLFISCKKDNVCDWEGKIVLKYDAKIDDGVSVNFILDNGAYSATLKYGEEVTLNVDADEDDDFYYVSAFAVGGGFLYENVVEKVKPCKTTTHKLSDHLIQ